MEDYLNYRKMITPAVIKIIFWIGVVFSILSGIILIVSGASSGRSDYGGGVPGGVFVLLGFIQLFVGPILVRMSCELTIVFFRIYETLVEIRGDSKAQSSEPLS